MAAIRVTASAVMVARSIFRPRLLPPIFSLQVLPVNGFRRICLRAPAGFCAVRCSSTKSGAGAGEKKSPARLAEVQRLMNKAKERYKDAGGGAEPIPQISLDHVTVSYARSGGPGGQNVNKVNTKVDMRFNVKNAHWLSERVREKIMQMEKNRINKDGELVISSTKTRTQKGNTEDALAKIQAIIDAASYVPPPPSEETLKKIAKLSAAGEQKRLDKKKALSQKKAQRRSRDSWD
ncbi:Class I peptide chain release factor [Striga hermonthica]|uniref:Class I peptide chain release factor n=1 Tax=Striga hermonthica TaxID=68872 RepID=A0A9N7MZL7_STRHE|nr:Class I peptide chain release factor [Striga hermonthica]